MSERDGDEEQRRTAVAALPREPAAIPRLLESLGDDSWRVRKEAVQRLAEWPDRAHAAAVLVETLAEPENVGRRNAAVEALARLGAVSVEPLLAALVPLPEHRKLIVDTLGLIGDRRAAAALVQTLDDSDENVRAAAAESLGQVGGPEAEAGLMRGLARGELLLSVGCLEALNRLGAAVEVARLRPLLETPVLRPATAAALGNARQAEAAALLVELLVDRSRSVREAAILSIDRLDEALPGPAAAALVSLGEDGERFLVQALMEGRPATRQAAARSLGLSRRVQAVRPLTVALGNPETEDAALRALASLGAAATAELAQLALTLAPESRAAVMRLLGAEGQPDARVQTTLLGALGETEIEVATAAAEALGSAGGVEAVASLVRSLVARDGDEGEELARAATASLRRIAGRHPEETRRAVLARGFGGPDAAALCRVLGVCATEADAPTLTAQLNADSAELRAAAAEALAGLPVVGEAVETALRYGLADESPLVRAAVVRALGRLDSEKAVGALAERCEDRDPLVRTEAVRAIGEQSRRAGGDSPAAREARARLVELAARTDGAVAAHAIDALASPVGTDTARPEADHRVFIGALGHADAEVVKAALRALASHGATPASDGGRGAEEIVAACAAALADPRWDVRRSAAATLARLPSSLARGPLAARLPVEEDALVREVIGAALAQLPAG